MKRLCIITAFLCTLPLMADEIHLNDGTIIRGRIIQVTPNNIEYDPDDNRNFSLVPRGQIKKLVYDDGNVVELNEGMIPALPEERPSEPDIKIPKQPERETRKAQLTPRTEEGVETHDGFFLRFQYGFGGSTATILDYSGSDMRYSGVCGVLRISPGYSVSPNLALFGVLGILSMIDSRMEWGGIEEDTSSTEIVSINFGIGITYYFMPVNIYISASINSNGTSYEGYYFEEKDLSSGSSFFLSAGKEWWVSDNWGIGAAVFAQIESGDLEIDQTGEKYKTKLRAYGIVFSATYN